MVKNLEITNNLKQYLIGINIFLIIILFALFIYWLSIIRPNQIIQSSRIGQYTSLNINNITMLKKLSNIAKNQNNSNTELIEKDYTNNISTQHNIDDLLNNGDKLLNNGDKLLKNNSVKNLPISDEKNKVKEKSKIAFIITNLGMNKKATELALTLPTECALGFLPYTKSLKTLIHKAKIKGHEIYLYLPLETDQSSYIPGKYALTQNLDSEQNAINLNIILNSQLYYKGIYTSYKEIFTNNPQGSEMLIDYLADRNLSLIIGKNNSKLLLNSNYPNLIAASIIIDKIPDKEHILAKLDELMNISKQKGYALGYTHGFTLSTEIINNWLSSLKDHEIILVPIEKIIKEQHNR